MHLNIRIPEVTPGVVMGNPSLVRGPDLKVAVHNVAEPVTQPKTGLNTGRT